MGVISDMMKKTEELGYHGAYLTAKVCQDLVLAGIAKSSLNRNITIKGGLVMRELTKDTRRATRDIDIDFIKYSLSDESIDTFVQKLNVLEGLKFVRVGEITELNHKDYHGKCITIRVTDDDGMSVESSVDIGVHTHLEIEQEEFCFDIAYNDEKVSLLVNSKEQMFSEKLSSLLKFGAASTRYKDVFDLHYLQGKAKKSALKRCLDEFIINAPNMKENSIRDVAERLERTIKRKSYRDKLNASEKNWRDIKPEQAFTEVVSYLKELEE